MLCGGVDAVAGAPSDPGDAGGEEVDAVTDEAAASTVVMLGGSGVGVPGQDLSVAQRHPTSRAFVMAA